MDYVFRHKFLIIHFNLQHCLNQALLVISLWENPCQLLLLRKKLVAKTKMISPIIQSIIQVKIYRIKTMLLTNMFNTLEERCYEKSLDNMKYRHHNGFNVFFTPDRGFFFFFFVGGGGGVGFSLLCPPRTTIK